MKRRESYGFIVTDENLQAVQRRPTIEEQVVVDDYRFGYAKAMGHEPHGLHYIPFPGVAETVPVWLPAPESTSPAPEG